MLKKQVHGNHISKSKKQMAKITDFFTLGTSSMGQCYNTFSVFQNYGAKHNSEYDSSA